MDDSLPSRNAGAARRALVALAGLLLIAAARAATAAPDPAVVETAAILDEAEDPDVLEEAAPRGEPVETGEPAAPPGEAEALDRAEAEAPDRAGVEDPDCAEAEAPEGSAPRRVLRAQRVARGAIGVDGRADDSGWAGAPLDEGFTQYHPAAGKPATQATRVRIAFDDRALYVLVEALDLRPEQIIARLARRDEEVPSDWINVEIDAHDDRRTALRFSVNPLGVKRDLALAADVEDDPNWDAVWEAATSRNEAGWTAEFAIPFGQLRYEADHPEWGLQVERFVARDNETSDLSRRPKSSSYPIRHYARLTGLDPLPRPWRLELSPYVTGAVARADQTELQGQLGGDGRVGLGSAFTLDLTVNPDFAQVEADPSVLNLTAFETFYQEKRPFFLQGGDIFQSSLSTPDSTSESLFYSRRVGRAPSRELDGSEGELLSSPTSTAILGAAKLTGKTRSGWAVGSLETLSDAEWATVRRAGGQRQLLVEPLTQAGVLRISRDLRDGQTVVGGLVTHLVRNLEADTAPLFAEQAFSGGLDLTHQLGDWGLLGRVFGSRVQGTPEAITRVQRSTTHNFQRPDADHLDLDPTRESLSGWGSALQVGRLSGSTWRGSLQTTLRSPELEVNDAGYQNYADDQTGQLWLQYRQDDPSSWHQGYQVEVYGWASRTFGDELTALVANADASVVLADTSTWTLGAQRNFARLDTSVLRGGPALHTPSAWSAWGEHTSDERRDWVVGLEGGVGGQEEVGGLSWWATPSLTLRPAAALLVSLSASWEHSEAGSQYFDTEEDPASGEPRYIVGRLIRDTASLTFRTNWTIHPELTLQLYLMPYLSAGTYETFFQIADAHAERYQDRFAADHEPREPKFLWSEVCSNLVLRWEYAPGSTLFAVWAHQQGLERGDRGALSPGGDLAELFRAAATDQIMVKVAYWLSI